MMLMNQKFDNGKTQIWFMKEMDDSKTQIKSTDKNTKLWLYYADAGTYGGNQLLVVMDSQWVVRAIRTNSFLQL